MGSTALRFGVVGFVAGVAAALMLTSIGSGRTLSAAEMHLLWPTAALGIAFTDWSDGSLWHLLRLLSIYASNGLVYALAACGFGLLLELLRLADDRLAHSRRARPRAPRPKSSRRSRLLRS